LSCAVSTTTTYLQDALINGPVNRSTIKITDRSVPQKTIVRSAISVADVYEIGFDTGTHTKVNKDGIFELEKEEYLDFFLQLDFIGYFKF
jgi:hypothetical protein